MLAHSGRRCGVNLSWRGTEASASVGLWESRVEWPCSVGIRSERVEAVGAAGRTTWTAVVGLADETSGRRWLCGVSLVRSSRRQPSTTACPGADNLPQGRGAAPNCCVAERRSENLGECHLWKENHRGVKIIRAQHYAGVDTDTIASKTLWASRESFVPSKTMVHGDQHRRASFVHVDHAAVSPAQDTH